MKMKVTRAYLEKQVERLNEWIKENPHHELVRAKKDNVMYYAQLLVEMDEKNLNVIEIWKNTH